MIISKSLHDSESLLHMCIPTDYPNPFSYFTLNDEQGLSGVSENRGSNTSVLGPQEMLN